MMEIHTSAFIPNAVMASAPAQQEAVLKLGAILDVIVHARLSGNRYELQPMPNGAALSGICLAELTIGQRLQVEVVRLGVVPELRILPTENQLPEVVTKALREFLPRQVDIRELISMLGRLPLLNPSSLPDSVRLALASLAAAVPQAEKLMMSDGLQRAVQNSGLFFEASLAAVLADGAAFPENDLKGRLLNLLAVLKEADAAKAVAAKNLQQETALSSTQTGLPSLANKAQDDCGKAEMPGFNLEKLAQKTEGALAKIAVDQLVSQPRDNGGISLQINVPFTTESYQDNAKLHITSENSAVAHDGQVNPLWTATVELQPPGIGGFNARIVWNGAQIDACLWSDREETSTLMCGTIETLRGSLEQSGLETGGLTVLDRPPAIPTEGSELAPLLDVRV